MTHQGLLVVSSPNKRYYGESRGNTGANPYHEHEFEPEEFERELARVFSNVRLMLQNRAESFAFHSPKLIWPAEARIDGNGGKPEDAHFLIALCSFGPLPEPRSFVYVPRAANVLREREQHIQLLEQSLAESRNDRDTLLALHRALNEEVEARNRWAQQLNDDLQATRQRVAQLQDEVAKLTEGYEKKIAELEEANRAKTAWALDTEARLMKELLARGEELVKCVGLLDAAEATVVERTEWAQRVESQRAQLAGQARDGTLLPLGEAGPERRARPRNRAALRSRTSEKAPHHCLAADQVASAPAALALSADRCGARHGDRGLGRRFGRPATPRTLAAGLEHSGQRCHSQLERPGPA